MKVPIRFTVVMEFERETSLSPEDFREFLEGHHCTLNVLRRLGELADTDHDHSVCNLCCYATVEVLPDGTEAYRGHVGESGGEER